MAMYIPFPQSKVYIVMKTTFLALLLIVKMLQSDAICEYILIIAIIFL